MPQQAQPGQATHAAGRDLAEIVADSPDALWLVSALWVTVAISVSAAALLGYSPSELTGQTVNHLTPIRENTRRNRLRSQVLLAGSIEADTPVVTKSGQVRLVAYHAVVIEVGGERMLLGSLREPNEIYEPGGFWRLRAGREARASSSLRSIESSRRSASPS